MNTNIVLSVLEGKIYGAWVYSVNEYRGGDVRWCVRLVNMSDKPNYKCSNLYKSEHVYIETLILHAMYAYNRDFV